MEFILISLTFPAPVSWSSPFWLGFSEQFFDLIRNLFENLWDCHWLTKHELNWAFFFYGDEKKLANLEHYFWSFYILDADMAVAILFFLFLGRWILSATVGQAHTYSTSLHVVLFVVAAMFALDAGLLRYEIKKHLRSNEASE